jgi:hypothetical protein
MVANSALIVCSFKCLDVSAKEQPGCQRVLCSQNRLQFNRIDVQAGLGWHLRKSERATTFVQIVQSCTGERWFLTLNDLLTHEVGRRAKNRPYLLSKMDCYKRRELTPVQQSSSERWEPKARVTFYISGTASFLLEYSGILPTVLQEKGAHGWTD